MQQTLRVVDAIRSLESIGTARTGKPYPDNRLHWQYIHESPWMQWKSDSVVDMF